MWRRPRWQYRRSLASRVTLLTTLAVGVTIAVMALVGFLAVRMQLQDSLDESLLNRATRAASDTTLSQITARDVPSWAVGAADVRIIFITADRQYFTADSGPKLTLGRPELEVAAGAETESVRTVVAEDGVSYRLATVPAGQGQALVLAQPLSALQRNLERVGTIMLFFFFAGVFAAGIAGWFVSTNGLRPVRRLTGAVEEVARTQELRPLAVEGDDEIGRLAATFNRMLTALSASRDRQRRLVADAGHELRTPLTSLRTNLDLLVQAGDSLDGPAREELLTDVRAQSEELSTLVGDLVELARDEPSTPVVEEVDLADVVERAVTRVRRRAPGLVFEVDSQPWPVLGEQASLERAITNLLDNAAKWSPEAGTVKVTLSEGALTVDDQGPGIPEEDLPHVFDRFYRASESRAMPGSGLGLAIVQQVVDRHGGQVRASRSPEGGARLAMWVPHAE